MKKLLNGMMILLLLCFCSCAEEEAETTSGIIEGESAMMGDSSIQTWAELDDDGVVIRVGFNAGASGLDALTDEEHLVVQWPEAVQSQTFFNHLGLDFQNEGHGPPPYLFPHFDVHFYGVSPTDNAAIDCVEEPLPEGLEAGVPASGNDYVPDFYLIPSTALDPDGTCVPGMGVHAVDVRSPELHEEPEFFTTTLVLGYHNGALTFLEPMVTQEYLAARSEWGWDVPRPNILGRSVLWPARFEATYDAESDTYSFEFSDFSAID
ncbi:MAG: hypothetical protein CMH54_14030 [Myxococcales bacterium]|nr:hypothetical protein [Myxococcales bacterium]